MRRTKQNSCSHYYYYYLQISYKLMSLCVLTDSHFEYSDNQTHVCMLMHVSQNDCSCTVVCEDGDFDGGACSSHCVPHVYLVISVYLYSNYQWNNNCECSLSITVVHVFPATNATRALRSSTVWRHYFAGFITN